MHTDPIADYLTRLRNAVAVRKKIVSMPSSKIKVGITQVLLDAGYLSNYKEVYDGSFKILKIALKYSRETKQPAMQKLTRVSKPGLRQYANSREIPRVMNGLGIAILSTSKGIVNDKQARENNLGGEVLCYIS